MRKPTQSDIESAQRGLRMVGMSLPELRELVRDFEGKEAFASQVIVIGAKQMIAAKRRAGARENPRGRKRNPSGVRIVYNRLLGGWYIVRGPHQTPLGGGRFDSKEQAQQHLIDQQNARDARVSYTRRNPAQRIRSTRRRPVLGAKRLRGRARVSMQGGTLGDANFHAVQVRRKSRFAGGGWYTPEQWTTLAAFPRGEFGKARATEYGKLLARRYPRQQFRVFWPDMIPRKPKGWIHPKKNPAPRASADGAEVERASRLFQAFTGHPVTKMRQVSLPSVKVGLAVGPVLEIAYETTRDGKRENYLHKFRRGARPLLAASQDGRTLLLLSGAYRFTSRGIVDMPQ